MSDIWLLKNVHGMTRGELLEAGGRLCEATLRASNMSSPVYAVGDTMPVASYGLYARGKITVNVNRCPLPVKTPGFSWRFPGWKADTTPFGVITHELGHHVDALTGHKRLVGWSKEPPVSSYARGHHEGFAEAVKLFITNPDLLRVGRPIRYATLIERGLVPIIDAPWWDVLSARGAHERFKQAAENWIKGGTGRPKKVTT